MCRVEARGPELPKRSCEFSPECGSYGITGVFHQKKAILFLKIQKKIHIIGISKRVWNDDCLDVFSHGLFHGLIVHVVGAKLDIDKNWLEIVLKNGRKRRWKCHRRR